MCLTAGALPKAVTCIVLALADHGRNACCLNHCMMGVRAYPEPSSSVTAVLRYPAV